jgi:TRAP-type C4-dicarboxylate transport system substrate-binding protein
MKFKKIILIFLLQVLVLTGPVYSLTIKIGSLAPKNSPWDKALRKMNSKWVKITNGQVRINILPFGVAGNRGEMLRKIQEGKLDGATLANYGEICPDIYVLNIPFLISSEKEFDYVFNKMKKYFEKRIESKGFKVIILAFMGWYYFFSKKPVFYPEDLQKHKLAFTEMRPEMNQAWKNAGYDIVIIDIKDMEMAMQKGNVNAFFMPPISAAIGQFFTKVPNMCSVKVSPVVGCLVISKKIWEKIPGKYKKQMMEVVQRESVEFCEEMKKIEKDAIEEMEENDLIVNKLPADALKKWQNTLDKFTGKLKKTVYSEEVYNRVQQYIKEYREKMGQTE